MSVKISIITVCYNAEQTISRTLRSVSEQTYSDIEYIIVDGESQDKTVELIQTLAPQALVTSRKDKGIYDAMNKGLMRATGDYVWYLNAGDALPSPNTVEAIVSQACPNGKAVVDIIYGDCNLIDSSGKVLGPRRLRPPSKLRWRTFRKGMLICHQSFIARRTLCPWYSLDYKFSSDVDWCIKVMKHMKQCHQITEPISLYLNEGTTSRNKLASLIERYRIMCKHYGKATTLWWHFRFLIGWR